MSIEMNVSVMFVPAMEAEGFNFSKASMVDTPAHWYVGIDFIEDNNAMTASIHEYQFVCKPTAKQLRHCKRIALAEHTADSEQFKLNYEHCFA